MIKSRDRSPGGVEGSVQGVPDLDSASGNVGFLSAERSVTATAAINSAQALVAQIRSEFAEAIANTSTLLNTEWKPRSEERPSHLGAPRRDGKTPISITRSEQSGPIRGLVGKPPTAASRSVDCRIRCNMMRVRIGALQRSGALIRSRR
jgi:hypothetical protein